MPGESHPDISHQLQSSGGGQFSLLTLDARLTAAHELSGQLPKKDANF